MAASNLSALGHAQADRGIGLILGHAPSTSRVPTGQAAQVPFYRGHDLHGAEDVRGVCLPETALVIECGVPKTKILEIAEEANVSAIVLGSHGRGNVRAVPPGKIELEFNNSRAIIKT
jgi:nucleotide-binding universal stress UspA family protein